MSQRLTGHFVYRLIPPRPTFDQDMSEDEPTWYIVESVIGHIWTNVRLSWCALARIMSVRARFGDPNLSPT